MVAGNNGKLKNVRKSISLPFKNLLNRSSRILPMWKAFLKREVSKMIQKKVKKVISRSQQKALSRSIILCNLTLEIGKMRKIQTQHPLKALEFWTRKERKYLEIIQKKSSQRHVRRRVKGVEDSQQPREKLTLQICPQFYLK